MKSHPTSEASESYRNIIQWWHYDKLCRKQVTIGVRSPQSFLICDCTLFLLLRPAPLRCHLGVFASHLWNSVSLKKAYGCEKAEAKDTCQSSLLLLFFHIKKLQRNLSFCCNVENTCNTCSIHSLNSSKETSLESQCLKEWPVGRYCRISLWFLMEVIYYNVCKEYSVVQGTQTIWELGFNFCLVTHKVHDYRKSSEPQFPRLYSRNNNNNATPRLVRRVKWPNVRRVSSIVYD